MSIYELSLIVCAAIVAMISRRNPRGVAWVAAITADLIATTAYWRSGLPYAEVFSGLNDAAICFGTYFIGRYRWEMWLWRLYQTSVLINIVYLACHFFGVGSVTQDVYSTLLEVVNWTAFLSIGGISAQWIGAVDAVAYRPWRRVRGPVFSLYRENAPTHAQRKAP